MKKQQVIIERLRSKWFPNADDKIWKQWVNYKRRETNDLIELLNSDVRDSFKRRVIFLLLVPSPELNPIYWIEEVGKLYHKFDFLKTLSPDLLSYATELIVEFNTMLKPMHCDKPENIVQGGGGITIFMSVPDKYHDALYYYNSCILLLLEILPEEQCERIFPLYSLLDISTYSGMEDASGYNPFQSLLYSNVEEKWKIKANASMKQIIMDEMAGKTKPREEWEDALKCYGHIINLLLYSEKLPYSTDLLASQIEFLVSEKHYGNELVDGSKVTKIFNFLSAEIYKDIRYQVAKFIFFGNKKKFWIWSEETLQGANMMLNEFGQGDEKLAQIINSAIEEYEVKSLDSKNKQLSTKNAENKIMSLMK